MCQKVKNTFKSKITPFPPLFVRYHITELPHILYYDFGGDSVNGFKCGNKFFGKKKGMGFWRKLHLKLCANAWWIFAWATFALFIYLLFKPEVFLMLVLFLLVCGLIFWLRI